MKGVLHQCSCCGFSTEQGVLVEGNVGGYITFVCERCFCDPNLFFSSKRILPHWTLAVKTQTVRRLRVRYSFGQSIKQLPTDEGIYSVRNAFLTKKSKREVAMSESLYKGQTQL